MLSETSGIPKEYYEFTHFVTLSLKQHRVILNDTGFTSLIRGDDIVYQFTYEGFIRSLSKDLIGKQIWKRRKLSIPNVGSIEGNGNEKRYHLHVCLRKPPHLSESDFQRCISKTASGNPWFEISPYAVRIDTLETPEDSKRAALYSLKHGLDRVLIA